jgi:hypothetical protein
MKRVVDLHVSELSLDLLLLGDLGQAESGAARKHLESCDTCRTRYAALVQARADFEQHVLPRTRPHVERSLASRTPRGRSKRTLGWSSALAATAVAALLMIWIRHPVEPDKVAHDDLRVKGAPSFTVFARRRERVFVVTDRARLQPGDRLRFVAEPGAYPYLLIVSVDAANHTTTYFPYQGEQSALVRINQRFEGEDGIELDDTAGPERIFALFTKAPLKASAVAQAMADLGRRGPQEIRLTDHLSGSADVQISLLIEK